MRRFASSSCFRPTLQEERIRTGVAQIHLIRHFLAVTLGERSVAMAAEAAQKVRYLLTRRNATSDTKRMQLTLDSRRLPPSEWSYATSQTNEKRLRRLCSQQRASYDW